MSSALSIRSMAKDQSRLFLRVVAEGSEGNVSDMSLESSKGSSNSVDDYGSTSSDMSSEGDGWHHGSARQERSIMPDMEKIPLPDDVKRRADAIFRSLNVGTRRGRRRLQLVFFCLYNSHRELDVRVDPHALGKRMGLSSGDITRACSMFSEYQTGYRPVISVTSPTDLLPQYCREVGLSEEALGDVVDLTQDVLTKDPDLRHRSPHTVAAGILRYYMFINGINTVSMSKYTRITDLSEATINAMFKRVSTAHNK